MQQKYSQISSFFLGLFLLLGGVFFTSSLVSAGPCSASNFNTCSWAWNDNIGWVAHNATDDPSTPAFGVHIPPDGGALTGHAWNDNLGYIDFAGATYDSATGEISGTASILDLGVNGTITLRGDCVPTCGGYGLSVTPSSVTGFAWNDTIGWIDFQPALGGVEFDENQVPSAKGWAWNDGWGWIAFRFTNYELDWGVNLEDNGNFTGYAWNDNVGWINYDPAGPFPSAPNHSAQWNPTTETVLGWVQILSMGTNGWIKLEDTGSIPYGIDLPIATGDWAGYGWNDALGWFWFDHAYGSVQTNFDQAAGPATPILQTPLDCVDLYTLNPDAGLTPSLEWSAYAALDGSLQDQFQIMVDDDPLFGSPEVDEIVPGNGNVYGVGVGILNYNTAYYWQVRVHSDVGDWSDYGTQGPAGESNCFRTQAHAAPDCSYTMDPAAPAPDEVVNFEAVVTTYGGSTVANYAWDFGDGDTENGPAASPTTHTYVQPGDYQVQLMVTDSSGYECTTQTDFAVQNSLPSFRRLTPR